MSWLSRSPIDPFLLAIIAAALAGTFLPVTGGGVDVLDWITTFAIALLFFLYGARLSPQETLAGLKHWRLHLTILSFTYVAFPLLGLAVAAVASNWLSPALVTGLVYLTLVPSTVQSSIAFTSIARGNVAGAVVSASASNILGVFLTPALCWLLLSGSIQFTPQAILDILLQLLLPFVLGQLSRRWTATWVKAHPQLKLVDRGSIVLVVYSAFAAGRRENMWQQTSLAEIGIVVGICLVVLAVMLVLSWWTARRLRFSVEDAIAIQFCGTKKSLASGLPMASVLFAGSPIGLLMLPLMIFHQAQLMACASLAERYARRPDATPVGAEA
ncbi:MAG: bile acid:sodium symporter family protein [Propionicimonas sp.]|nr:bile acid:sodium symporter family protein [Propionicimonas sp.]